MGCTYYKVASMRPARKGPENLLPVLPMPPPSISLQ